MIKVVKTTNSRVHRITILSINIFWSAEEILKANQKNKNINNNPPYSPIQTKSMSQGSSISFLSVANVYP